MRTPTVCLNLSGLSALTPEAYAGLLPVQWPVAADGQGTPRLFVERPLPDPRRPRPHGPDPAQGPADAVDAAYPMSLNTGRIRDQWHTMTRTGLAPDLCRHAPEPFVEVHPADAEALGVKDGALARVITARGEAVALAKVTDRQRPGGLFMPMHWTDAFAPSGRSIRWSRRTWIPLRPAGVQAHPRPAPRLSRDLEGLLSHAGQPRPPYGAGPRLAAHPPGRLPATRVRRPGRRRRARRLRKALSKGLTGELVTYEDAATGARRDAWLRDGRLVAVLYVTLTGRLPPRDWLAELFAEPVLSPRPARPCCSAARPARRSTRGRWSAPA
jgi:assimilatory nitrate reductase catalytic subunit